MISQTIRNLAPAAKQQNSGDGMKFLKPWRLFPFELRVTGGSGVKFPSANEGRAAQQELDMQLLRRI